MPLFAPDSWYEPDSYEETAEDHGYIHQDNLPDFELIASSIQGIVRSVYESGDLEDLEDYLEELCTEFDLELPARKPVLQKRPVDLSNHLFNLGVTLSRVQAKAAR